jgi:hypothetical protein
VHTHARTHSSLNAEVASQLLEARIRQEYTLHVAAMDPSLRVSRRAVRPADVRPLTRMRRAQRNRLRAVSAALASQLLRARDYHCDAMRTLAREVPSQPPPSRLAAAPVTLASDPHEQRTGALHGLRLSLLDQRGHRHHG